MLIKKTQIENLRHIFTVKLFDGDCSFKMKTFRIQKTISQFCSVIRLTFIALEYVNLSRALRSNYMKLVILGHSRAEE